MWVYSGRSWWSSEHHVQDQRYSRDLTWEATAAKPTEVNTMRRPTLHTFYPPGTLNKKVTWPKTKASADGHPSASFIPPCSVLFFLLLYSSLPSSSSTLYRQPSCFCKRCVVFVRMYLYQPGTWYCPICFLFFSLICFEGPCYMLFRFERASYAPWCQPLTLPAHSPSAGTFLHPALNPCHLHHCYPLTPTKVGEHSLCVSSGPRWEFLLGTLTQTWMSGTGEQCPLLHSVSCARRLSTGAHVSANTCHYPPLLIWWVQLILIGALVLCFWRIHSNSFSLLWWTGSINCCLPFAHFFLLGYLFTIAYSFIFLTVNPLLLLTIANIFSPALTPTVRPLPTMDTN